MFARAAVILSTAQVLLQNALQFSGYFNPQSPKMIQKLQKAWQSTISILL